MNIINPKTPKWGPLAYGLRESVTYHERDGAPILILNFPLKVVVLASEWKGVLRLFSNGNFLALEKITSQLEHLDPDKIENFLDDLVRKGFLERKGVSALREYPLVSIIIPVRNRPDEIRACLSSLHRLDYPLQKIEIIVVDDASSDHTPDVVAEFPVTLIALQDHRQASYCRNLGAQKAGGDILAFIDSDCLADVMWLKELVPAFKDFTLAAVGGMVDAWDGQKALDRYEKVKSALKISSWFKHSRQGENFFYVPACNLLVPRDVFLKLDGFREDLHVGEDVDFCWRLQDCGYHVEYRPVGKVYHRHRNRWQSFCRRRFDYGTSEPMLQQMHAKRIKRIVFPLGETLFWCTLIAALFFKSLLMGVLAGTSFSLHALTRYKMARRQNIPLTLLRITTAIARSYLAFIYHCSTFVSRYYLIWSIIVFPFFPAVALTILGMHLLAGLGEYYIRRPRLNALTFVFYFTLEQLSYQLGVWWGCVRRAYFKPVNPQITVRRSV
jgi:mycofactocin system glycosyltransferase